MNKLTLNIINVGTVVTSNTNPVEKIKFDLNAKPVSIIAMQATNASNENNDKLCKTL
ncbi:hypothetical protein KC675_01875 [Candidatus Dojkabacteria bacterium]|uniref:Uncharacterized protein n=1 Tax=Candidatus Dojkabacteria bacterium TaxID=2099670 RepID=A0A955L0W2_9BACT|nr:hypothetical protein [Candidatus Dojkabacteria bacterium]